MWYFAWVLGLGFAVLLAIVSAIWVEFAESRARAFEAESSQKPKDS